MAVTQFSGCTWYPIRSGNICPICGSKKGRCAFMTNKDNVIVMYRCKYAQSNRPSRDGWYIHLANEINGDTPPKIIDCADYKPESITDELLDLWDKVYKEFRNKSIHLSGSALYPAHKKNLIDRGLDEKTINALGCFSIPLNNQVNYKNYQCSLRTSIVNSLLEYFKPESLIRVPGFRKIKSNNKEFISFKNSIYNNKTEKFEDIDGFFIPYNDYKNRLVGMQYRLTTPVVDEKGKPIRYFWYTTKENSCGSPIDYHIPQNLIVDDAILLTEGALKAKIASEIFGIRSLAEAGVSNYRKLIQELQLVAEHENKKYKILLALDMDKYTNNDVLAAEINTVLLLKSLGYSVTILEWDINKGKGIDDKLTVSKEGFRYLTV